MFKIPVTYNTFDGVQKTKDFYFNLTRAELARMHLSIPGGFDGFMARLKDNPEWDDVDSVFEKIILTAYGKRTPAGKFIKDKEYSQEFAASDAYSEVFLMFLNNEDNFVDKFLSGCLNVPLEEVTKVIDEQTPPKIEAEF